jgi:hypothetical protein
MAKTTREWLLEIATAVANWPTMQKDLGGGGGDYPQRCGGVHCPHADPAEDREEVRDALPALLPADFTGAARRIRQAATPLPT